MWARPRERKITVPLESRDGALLKTKLLVRWLYEKARENLCFDICLIKVKLFCCTHISRGLLLFQSYLVHKFHLPNPGPLLSFTSESLTKEAQSQQATHRSTQRLIERENDILAFFTFLPFFRLLDYRVQLWTVNTYDRCSTRLSFLRC